MAHTAVIGVARQIVELGSGGAGIHIEKRVADRVARLGGRGDKDDNGSNNKE
jgi:hypothetical protein